MNTLSYPKMAPIARVLPYDAAQALVRASKRAAQENNLTARAAIIETAIARVVSEYPSYFYKGK